MKPCEESWSLDTKLQTAQKLALEKKMMCADLSPILLKGNYFSNKFVTVEFGVEACLGGPEDGCADVNEVEKFFLGRKVNVIYKNTHLDTDREPKKIVKKFG